ncbi:MAG: endopeptidase La [Chromatiales bacterium]|jgi:ATP-dependent Lon protease|nr:endopeptidase La [Chromatiales bacterium]
MSAQEQPLGVVQEGEVEVDPPAATENTNLAIPAEVAPNTVHVLPMMARPFFPVQTAPVILPKAPWFDTMQAVASAAHHLVALVMVRDGADGELTSEGFHTVGTVARVHHAATDDATLQFVAEGQQRVRIVRWLSAEAPFLAQVEYLDNVPDDGQEVKAYAMAVMATIKELINHNPLFGEEVKQFLNRFSPTNPSLIAQFAATITTADADKLQAVLEIDETYEQLQRVHDLLRDELEVAKLHTQIRSEVEDKMTDQQRRFFLQEQLKVIQSELGISKDDRTSDVEQFLARLEGLTIPEAAKTRIDEEVAKFSVLETGSPEYAVTRNYLDWVSSLPWGVQSKDQLDLKKARTILDADHTGLEDVKERITEFLAVGKLRGSVGGSIILLVGPPGVGKTSVGRSVASALGREFYRFSVGGMRDEAEIKGHRRTYIGAMPGKFIQALKEVGTDNPVLMLDEVDKIGNSYQGDPASALLEVLDPEQNSAFLDHYLDLRFDLSKALFICTANQLDTIPRPLLDRMEVIRLAGYITEEKVAIARQHLWPRQVERAGLKASQVKISDAALKSLINGYARESGVRGLEKQLGRITRKAAVRVVHGDTRTINVGPRNLDTFVGKPIFMPERPQRAIGVVTGLAWTSMGGATLDVEATQVHTKNRAFKLTGQLGDVMRESAEIAYSYVSSNLAQYGGEPAFFDEAYVHLHVPEGATPKDGPSAGVTMATSLLSLARGQRIRTPAAMTGELTLTGKVLPVGGIREKVVAARRAGVKTLILPAANKADADELPDYLAEGITFHFAEHYNDVFNVVFGPR